ncbi:class I SAM-dependent methyltransferase [Pseudonocardia nigra]|uniref:class I SAM-dependent methyltransferase n=1 Tax=Pseudonocardia nigra TaxID=1921578 RepID=UPI001C5FC181|nr:NAD-binding protein [Pseudonocardia nigra]
MSDGRLLFREFLRAPTRVATVTASSDALVAAMIAPLLTSLPADGVVVELGAGTGRVTEALQRVLGGRGAHLAIELNPLLAERLAARHPGVTVVRADAARLPEVLREHGIDRADAVSSLLPWAAYAAAPIPAIVAAALAPTGTFTQASLLPTRWMGPARRQERDLRDAFGQVTPSPPVWRNLPPARVLVARRPAGVAAG